ncbi:hypothetical protein EDB84DRAFT_1439858 [Lactarius hengduanensis]|nr:hypothetical protein EDB84DRAFT_1439858 [Lactarius hengduanensis]
MNTYGDYNNQRNKQFTCPQSVQSGLNAEDAIRNGPPPLVGAAPVLAAVLKRASRPNKLESPACRHDKMSDTSDIRLEMYLNPTHRMMAPINAPAKSGKEDPVIVTAGAMRRNELSSTSSVTIIQYNLNSQRGRFPPGLIPAQVPAASSQSGLILVTSPRGSHFYFTAVLITFDHNGAVCMVIEKQQYTTPSTLSKRGVDKAQEHGADEGAASEHELAKRGSRKTHACCLRQIPSAPNLNAEKETGNRARTQVWGNGQRESQREAGEADAAAQGWRQHAVQLQIRKMIPRLWSLQAAVYNDEELPLLEATRGCKFFARDRLAVWYGYSLDLHPETKLLQAWKQDDRTSDASAIARGKEGGLALTANLRPAVGTINMGLSMKRARSSYADEMKNIR